MYKQSIKLDDLLRNLKVHEYFWGVINNFLYDKEESVNAYQKWEAKSVKKMLKEI